jgi:hypothetical protein
MQARPKSGRDSTQRLLIPPAAPPAVATARATSTESRLRSALLRFNRRCTKLHRTAQRRESRAHPATPSTDRGTAGGSDGSGYLDGDRMRTAHPRFNSRRARLQQPPAGQRWNRDDEKAGITCERLPTVTPADGVDLWRNLGGSTVSPGKLPER